MDKTRISTNKFVRFLKNIAMNLFYLTAAIVLLLLPTLITLALYWRRLTEDVIFADAMIQFIWLILLATLYITEED